MNIVLMAVSVAAQEKQAADKAACLPDPALNLEAPTASGKSETARKVSSHPALSGGKEGARLLQAK